MIYNVDSFTFSLWLPHQQTLNKEKNGNFLELEKQLKALRKTSPNGPIPKTSSYDRLTPRALRLASQMRPQASRAQAAPPVESDEEPKDLLFWSEE